MGHPDVVNTWFLRNPSSPHLAFALEGITYDAAPIHDLIISSRKNFDFIIMEGAGGIRVPITEKLEMTDIAKLSSFPTLVVAKPGLGTINHTLLTLEHLASRRLPLAGFVFSEPEQAKFAEALAADNAHIIQARTGVPFLGCIPYFKGEWSLSDLTSHPLADYFRRTK
jgi:dethiobiotin synthetase